MSIYIPGLNLPPKGEAYMIDPDGVVYRRIPTNDGDDAVIRKIDVTIIEVQPHGRLGDLDAIPMREQFKPFSELEQAYCDGLEFCRDLMPTIIPADGADKEEL